MIWGIVSGLLTRDFMKHTLKGVGRYYPGCLYGLMLLMILMLILFLSGVPLDLLNTKTGKVILVVAVLTGTAAFMSVGEGIYNWTVQRLHKKHGSMSKAKKKGQILEIVIFISFDLLLLLTPLAMMWILRHSEETAAKLLSRLNTDPDGQVRQ